jgi:hypothetical protein
MTSTTCCKYLDFLQYALSRHSQTFASQFEVLDYRTSFFETVHDSILILLLATLLLKFAVNPNSSFPTDVFFFFSNRPQPEGIEVQVLARFLA